MYTPRFLADESQWTVNDSLIMQEHPGTTRKVFRSVHGIGTAVGRLFQAEIGDSSSFLRFDRTDEPGRDIDSKYTIGKE